MKNFISTLLLVFMSILAFAQEGDDLPHASIYLLRTGKYRGSGLQCSIQFENQQKFILPAGAVIQYKIYSQGEISIAAEYALYKTYYCNLNVKQGNDYYVYLDLNKFSEVPKEEVQKILDSRESFTKRTENLDFPINRKSIESVVKNEGKRQGTCFLISNGGYFITNYHCVENAKEITIKGIDGDFVTKYAATVIASDPSNDLALVKIENRNIKFPDPPFAIRSSGVEQAEKVYALGYPKAETMGDEIKITEGIISAKSGIRGDVSKFQISAAVNPGNSGGLLIDEDGNLIGVIVAKSGIAEAAGYAIKSGYLEAFLKNVDNFVYPQLVNSIKEKELPQKVDILKGFIFIIETK